ncbi:MAG TPA: hypothetical protein VGR41_05550 [Actinomycetota bacterium]|nr:hypothetical protein [Actinomycetota bacterium]
MTKAEPERELVRRALPFFLPAVLVAFVIGAATVDRDAGYSAAVAIVIVAVNFVANGVSLAWAAGISPIAIFAVGLGGFVARLAIFAVAMVALTTADWFSAKAFIAAFVPATMVLLAFEMTVLAGRRMQADLWYFQEGTRG